MPRTGHTFGSAPKFYTVPAGTRSSQCNGSTCRAVIYWIENPDTGRKIPIDCDVEGGESPSETNDRRQRDMFAGSAFVHDGRGVSHFTTCPDVGEFSRGGRH
ncbi:MAG TPA: hypothetical protein VHB25_04305 [Gemmatimonadaceae bacterium]|nr:hypothetical protein [Gemmatimonadaceae bacterium]